MSFPTPSRRQSAFFALLALACAVSAPAFAKELGSCKGEADDKAKTEEFSFTLAADGAVNVKYELEANPEDATPNLSIHIQRKLPNGSFVTFKLINDLSASGQTNTLQLPTGEYKVKVTALHAKFSVTADRE